jgi:hypothetical protein
LIYILLCKAWQVPANIAQHSVADYRWRFVERLLPSLVDVIRFLSLYLCPCVGLVAEKFFLRKHLSAQALLNGTVPRSLQKCS